MGKHLKKVFTVTKDRSANYQVLKKLGRQIKIFEVDVKDEKSKFEKQLPTAVWGHTRWGHSLWGGESESKNFEKIKKIIGNNNIEDSIIVTTHIRENNDYLVSEDKDIVSKVEDLSNVFPEIKIFNPDEFVKHIQTEDQHYDC